MLELNLKPMLRTKIRSQGFTLVELMVTIAILAIILTIVGPSFVEIRRSAELNSAISSLIAVINTTRSEAMKRGMNAVIAPTTGTDWNAGITTFIDANGDNVFNDSDILIQNVPVLPRHFSISQSSMTPNLTVFNASGFAHTMTAQYTSTFTIMQNDLTSGSQEEVNQTRRIKVSLTGRVTSCKPKSTNDAAC